jgi:hypothetical protein
MTTPLHHFSSDTGEATYTELAEEDPNLGTIAIMSFSTTDAKPDASTGHKAVYLDEQGKPPVVINGGTWRVVPDNRGTTYWQVDRTKVTIKELGEVVPVDALMEDPGPSLADAKVTQIRLITRDCASAITSGFVSSALGEPITYPSEATDQTNLNASVTASLIPGLPADWTTPFMCQDAQGVWDARMHTAAQIQQVGADAKNMILATLGRKWLLQTQIQAAETVEQVNAMTWEQS